MRAARSVARRKLPGPAIPAWRRTLRYWLSRLVVYVVARGWVRVRFEGREHLPDGPAIYCFNHLSWTDPFVLMGILPFRPRLYFFGPKEEDMAVGGRNRLMHWTGTTIPYKPGKNDLLEATRHVAAVIDSGGIVAIAGEGRIGPVETELQPLNEGPAYFAMRSHVPLVPIAINGTSWVRFGGRVRVRVGAPIVSDGRPDRAAIAATTEALRVSLLALLADAPPVAPPGPIGRWLTDRFNDWPEGSRAAALGAAQRVAVEDVEPAPDLGEAVTVPALPSSSQPAIAPAAPGPTPGG
jgi:1-acyl-sn-glycerol-3-phosphate acyltransferase